MIPFASQRGYGQDLATHLQNALDNEYVELGDLRGAIADDLHGAFAEWEAQASAMTRCKNYLYSLSVNPDDRQGPMPRALYEDYVHRVETALGLQDQPRAIVYHIKEGREHAHVVWSRIDVQGMKAIHMAFDHEKLMGVTRSFAREHGIELAPGYHRLEERKRQTYRQLTLADKAQQESVGITREERSAVITDLWRRRDTPTAFLASLEHSGYLLANGRRPFVLVDIYGCTNSLPKLIDDRAVTTKVIRAFLGEAGDEKALPTVEEAKELAQQHRMAMKDVRRNEERTDKRESLTKRQAKRRAELEQEAAKLNAKQEAVRERQATLHDQQRTETDKKYIARTKLIHDQRQATRPTGLVGVLARVSGFEFARGKVRAFQDRKRDEAHRDVQAQLEEQQAIERRELQRRHSMRMMDMERKRRALDLTEKRERQSLEKEIARNQVVRQRGEPSPEPMPALTLSPPGRPAAPYKAMKRYTSELAREMQLAKQRSEAERKQPGAPDVAEAFERAAKGEVKAQEQRSGGLGSVERSGVPVKKVQRDRGKGRER